MAGRATQSACHRDAVLRFACQAVRLVQEKLAVAVDLDQKWDGGNDI